MYIICSDFCLLCYHSTIFNFALSKRGINNTPMKLFFLLSYTSSFTGAYPIQILSALGIKRKIRKNKCSDCGGVCKGCPNIFFKIWAKNFSKMIFEKLYYITIHVSITWDILWKNSFKSVNSNKTGYMSLSLFVLKWWDLWLQNQKRCDDSNITLIFYICGFIWNSKLYISRSTYFPENN